MYAPESLEHGADDRSSALPPWLLQGNQGGVLRPRRSVRTVFFEALDEKYMRDLGSLVSDIKLEDIAVAMPDRTVAHLSRYALITVLPPGAQDDSQNMTGYLGRIPEGIRTSYRGREGNPPYLDTSHGIGLVYNDHLIALSGAYLDHDDGNLVIVQVQDVSGVNKTDGRAYYRTGHHNGLRWRDTLVNAWETVATTIGASYITIQSDYNNYWADTNVGDSGVYDDLAARLGYTYDIRSYNWHHVLGL